MNLDKLKTRHFLFDPLPFGRIFAFVDFGNVRPWAKDIWAEENKFRLCVEIDIKKIYDICSRVSVSKSFFYYGYFPPDEAGDKNSEKTKKHNKSIFRIDKARKCGFDINTKVIKMIPHYDEEGKFRGKFPKCNFDVEMTMEMLMNVDNYDTVMLFSGTVISADC